MGNLFEQLVNNYRKLDKKTGGWLPGGGTASPITKAVFPAQPFPGRSEELKKQTGVNARFIDPKNTPSTISAVAPLISSQWGESDYANSVLAQVGMSEYTGGKTSKERQTEYHELGHLNPKDKQLYSYLGVSGRALQGLSERTGNFAPLDLAAGFALINADAPEEDRAERFAANWAERGNFPAPQIYSDGTSGYGNSLRRQGRELTNSAIERMTNPFGLRTQIGSFFNKQRAKPLQAELTKSLPAYRQMLKSSGDELTPEVLAETKRLRNLQDQLEALGVEVKY